MLEVEVFQVCPKQRKTIYGSDRHLACHSDSAHSVLDVQITNSNHDGTCCHSSLWIEDEGFKLGCGLLCTVGMKLNMIARIKDNVCGLGSGALEMWV